MKKSTNKTNQWGKRALFTGLAAVMCISNAPAAKAESSSDIDVSN